MPYEIAWMLAWLILWALAGVVVYFGGYDPDWRESAVFTSLVFLAATGGVLGTVLVVEFFRLWGVVV